MTTYTGRIIEDEEGPILLIPDELSRESGWGIGAEVCIAGDRNEFTIQLLKKGAGKPPPTEGEAA